MDPRSWRRRNRSAISACATSASESRNGPSPSRNRFNAAAAVGSRALNTFALPAALRGQSECPGGHVFLVIGAPDVLIGKSEQVFKYEAEPAHAQPEELFEPAAARPDRCGPAGRSPRSRPRQRGGGAATVIVMPATAPGSPGRWLPSRVVESGLLQAIHSGLAMPPSTGHRPLIPLGLVMVAEVFIKRRLPGWSSDRAR